jgi:hypothetical protein
MAMGARMRRPEGCQLRWLWLAKKMVARARGRRQRSVAAGWVEMRQREVSAVRLAALQEGPLGVERRRKARVWPSGD